jgi:phytoene dehydrogenase-like protein
MGSISNCLAHNAKSFENNPIEIYLNQRVSQIVVEGSATDRPKTTGVLLDNGHFIEADFVLSNCTPHVTFTNLLDSYKLDKHVNENIAAFFKRVTNIDYESGTMKINLAVTRLPNFSADPTVDETKPMPHHRCTIHINCENVAILEEAYKDARVLGRGSRKPMIEMVIPSALDPTLAPPGCHVVLLFCQYFPIDRQTNETTRQLYAQTVLDAIETYAPGFKSSIVGAADILTPLDLERTFGLTGGNIFHGAMPLNQLFISRPVVGWSTYGTPVENLYLAGSGAHPGGGVMGSAGRLAALECLTKMKSAKQKTRSFTK